MTEKQHDCWDELEHAKYVARATWLCRTCGRDVSVEYCLLAKSIEEERKQRMSHS